MMRSRLIALVLVGILAATGVALAAGTPAISRHVIAGGGGEVSAGSYTLKASVGQAITYRVTGGTHDLCAGFWCGLARYKVFLPLVVRN